MNATAIIVQFFRDMNDEARTRWQETDAIYYLNDALLAVFNARPDAFTITKNVTLVAGSTQSVAGCVDLMSVNQNSPSGGFITRGDLDLFRTYNGDPCSLPRTVEQIAGYEVDQWFYDQRNPGTWFVYPPVPAGVTVTVQVTCKELPVAYTVANLGTVVEPQRYRSALLEWMKKRAYEVDSESLTSFNLMQFHAAQFDRFMGIGYTADSRHQSGYEVGRIGTGDPRVVRP